MIQTSDAEKMKTNVLSSIPFFPENHAIYETMCKNTAQPDRPHTTIRRMRIACWITKATNTLTRRNVYCLSTATMVVTV